MQSSINLYPVAGLVYDIVGAIVLAKGIATGRTEVLAQQARNYGQFSTGNLALFSALDEQRNDARFGLWLLAIGFLLQLLTSLGFQEDLGWEADSLFAGSLVVALCAWQITACRLAATRRQRFLDTLDSWLAKENFNRTNPEEPLTTLCYGLRRFLSRFSGHDADQS